MDKSLTGDLAARRRAIYGATFALLFLAYPFLRRSTWQGDAELHTLIELATTLLALIVGILALVRFYSKKDNAFLFIATGFIGTGFLDGYHAVVSAPVFKQYFPSPPPSLIPWSGFASRLFLSVLLWLSWAFWKREARLGEAGRVPESRVYLIVGMWTLACFSFFAFVPLPLAYEPVPIFHRPQEVLPTIFFFLALIGYLRKGRWKSDPFEHWLVLSIILCVGQALLMSTSAKLYDTVYITSHLVKILSYICTLAGLIVAMYHLFLAEERIVDERTKELQKEITERKRAQEATLALLRSEQLSAEKAREERALSEAVIQGLPAIVSVFDDTGRFLRWNARFETVLGYSAAEIEQIRASDTVAEEDRDLLQQTVQRVFENGSAETEVSLVNKNGTKVPCYMTGVRIVVDNKPCLLGAAIDISKHKQAEVALRESEEQFRQLADNISEVFFILTPEPVRTAYISPAYDQIWGRPRQELYDRAAAWIESVHPEDRERVDGVFVQCMQGLPTEMEYRVIRPDGPVRWIHARSFPVCDSEGKFIRVVGIAEDTTERRRVLDEIRAAKSAAEAANRTKSEFLANMSHELRTPMNGIMGMTDLALETELTSEQREYLSLVKSSADSLLTVINDILDFSKMETGKLEFDAIEFNFRSSLESTLKVLALRAHEKGLELNCRVRPEVPEILIGDPSRLRQILVNLVGNAIKFTERGEVTVQVEQQSEEAGIAVLHFSIADTGIGIPDVKQKTIFNAFSQADGSTARRYGGTGLGLTIARQLTEMLGGRLWLESVVGRGSTFHFTARLAVGAGSRCHSPLPVVNLKGMTVLVVDDNSTNRRILEEMLAGWHMKPALAEEARTALTQLKQAADAGQPFPLVLIDAKMPEVDGFALVERIRQEPQLATATIMMLTSAGQRGDAARCRQLGVAAYLTKPIVQTELLDATLRVLGAKGSKIDQAALLVTNHTLREHRKGLRILLAEDNLVNRTLAARVLEKHGHTVEVATDGREALAKLTPGSFDLVLMDVQMPEMDGFEATIAIRNIEKTKGGHLPIIAITAHALKGDRERCLAAGMDGYISKPIHADELLKEIESLPI